LGEASVSAGFEMKTARFVETLQVIQEGISPFLIHIFGLRIEVLENVSQETNDEARMSNDERMTKLK